MMVIPVKQAVHEWLDWNAVRQASSAWRLSRMHVYVGLGHEVSSNHAWTASINLPCGLIAKVMKQTIHAIR